MKRVTTPDWCSRRARIQMYDAPFSLHTSELPNHGVMLPGVGVRIKVLEEGGTAMKVRFD